MLSSFCLALCMLNIDDYIRQGLLQEDIQCLVHVEWLTHVRHGRDYKTGTLWVEAEETTGTPASSRESLDPVGCSFHSNPSRSSRTRDMDPRSQIIPNM